MDTLFWLTILVIFLATLGAALVRRLRKDPCLKFLHDHHVTYISGEGAVLWGDADISGQGLELRYDAPFRTSRGLVKTSYLVFSSELETCTAICRSVQGLTEEERHDRSEQVRQTFNPKPVARLLRTCRNFIDLIRDAVTKSFGMFVGALATRGGVGKAVQSGSSEVGELGKTVIGAVANAYEPLLERYIGKPVVVSFKNSEAATEPVSEFPGYLVEYSEKFVAVFNVDHNPEESMELELDGELVREGLQASTRDGRLRILCTGPDALVVHSVGFGDTTIDLGVTLVPGCVLEQRVGGGDGHRLLIERTRHIDFVCPRSQAQVRFGSLTPERHRRQWFGIAPDSDGQ